MNSFLEVKIKLKLYIHYIYGALKYISVLFDFHQLK